MNHWEIALVAMAYAEWGDPKKACVVLVVEFTLKQFFLACVAAVTGKEDES